jgi:hypothetical protein
MPVSWLLWAFRETTAPRIEQHEGLVGVQRGVAERCPAVSVVVTDRVEGGVAVVATTEEVRRVAAVGSEKSASRASG